MQHARVTGDVGEVDRSYSLGNGFYYCPAEGHPLRASSILEGARGLSRSTTNALDDIRRHRPSKESVQGEIYGRLASQARSLSLSEVGAGAAFFA